MSTLPPRVALPTLGGHLKAQRAKRSEGAPATPTPLPPAKQTTPPAPPRSGGAPDTASLAMVKTSLNLTIPAKERLRQLATDAAVSQTDALLTQVSRLAKRGDTAPEATTQMGEFTINAGGPPEVKSIVTLRITRSNLEALDRVQHRLGFSSRSDLANYALAP